jgi:hypothetical protein
VGLTKRPRTDDNARLKEFVAKDLSIVRAAAALDRNLMSVRNQARKIGTPFPPMLVLRKNLADTSSRLWRYVATRATTAQI